VIHIFDLSPADIYPVLQAFFLSPQEQFQSDPADVHKSTGIAWVL
jgi:hypothetical protein